MFSTWDIVRPRMWHPMSMLEQSMMDMDMMANQMLQSRYPMTVSMMSAPNSSDDDEFFKDIPVESRGKQAATKQPESQKEEPRVFSSYSFSNSSVVDDKGRRVVSTRRRYEDSTGRLKAEHEREVDGRRAKTIWHKMTKDDQGTHETLCSDGSVDEFEQLWSQTPFGRAQVEKSKELKAEAEKELLETQGQQTQHGHQQTMAHQQGNLGQQTQQPGHQQTMGHQQEHQGQQTQQPGHQQTMAHQEKNLGQQTQQPEHEQTMGHQQGNLGQQTQPEHHQKMTHQQQQQHPVQP